MAVQSTSRKPYALPRSIADIGQTLSVRAVLQVAANNRGIQLVGELIEEYSLEVVQAYMRYIQACPTVALNPASAPQG